MNNILTVAKREFVTRAFKKKFLLITFFMPLIIAAFSGSIGFIMSYRNDRSMTVLLSDHGGLIDESTSTWDNITLIRDEAPIDSLKLRLKGSVEGVLYLPPMTSAADSSYLATYYTDEQVDLETNMSLQSLVRTNVKNQRLTKLGIDKSSIDRLDRDIRLEQVNTKGDKDIGSMVAAALGGIFGFFLYLLLTINGSMIMRSVMEEKTSRIIEVMVSTVRPRDLMFGKILGVGLVGLFQVIIWCITTPLFIFGITTLFFGGTDMAAMPGANVGTEEIASAVGDSMLGNVLSQLAAINWMVLIPLLFLFFLLGYLMYASLFAAVGSTMGDDQGEGQSLTMLVIMPLLFAFYISISAIRAPDSSMAVWSSIIPLFSPIVMPVRLAFSPPWWQIGLSLVLLIVFSLFFAWLSARIYRIGILMYGKKATLRDMAKWIRSK